MFRTPPFSSEEELDADDLVQAFASPDVLPVLPSKSNKSSFVKSTVKSDTDWTEGSEIEDSDISPKPTGKLSFTENPPGNFDFRTVVLSSPYWASELRKFSRKQCESNMKVLVPQSCVTLCDPMDCRLPGSSVLEILQAGILALSSNFASQGALPNAGIQLGSPALQADSLQSEPPGKKVWG